MQACLSSTSVVRIACAKSTSPSGRSACVARTIPVITEPIGSGTPITPVEATATAPSGQRLASAAAPCILAAFSNPGRPVAAFALPELTTIARTPFSVTRSRHSSTGADCVPEAVNRAALVVAGALETSSPTSGWPLGLIPHATPAALNPCGSPPPGSDTLPGTSTQRDPKNDPVVVTGPPRARERRRPRSPPPRAARASG